MGVVFMPKNKFKVTEKFKNDDKDKRKDTLEKLFIKIIKVCETNTNK